MPMLLSAMRPGQIGIMHDMTASGPLGQRLMDLGFYPGASIRMVRNAPLIDPMEIELDGYHVSIRHEEAEFVEIDLPQAAATAAGEKRV